MSVLAFDAVPYNAVVFTFASFAPYGIGQDWLNTTFGGWLLLAVIGVAVLFYFMGRGTAGR